jgi:5-methylcytosine-specific restriction protein B
MEELGARSWFGKSHSDLSEPERRELAEHAIARCTFHPAYGYEDFLVGYRPRVEGGNLTFVPKRGIFAELCRRAAEQPGRQFYLLVDEINRGDIPRIFGELLTVLEKDKRGLHVLLPMLDEPFVVPPNIGLIGTMNTADRSIALLDAALRRRFAFIELMPDSRVLRGVSVEGLPVGPWLDALNRRVVRHAGRDSRNLQVGHSYLMSGSAPIEDPGRFVEVLRDDIVPLLQEYCYDDFEALRSIVGGTIVLAEQKRIDESLFEPARRSELFAALLSEFSEITATSAAAEADALDGDDEPADEDDEPDDAGA